MRRDSATTDLFTRAALPATETEGAHRLGPASRFVARLRQRKHARIGRARDEARSPANSKRLRQIAVTWAAVSLDRSAAARRARLRSWAAVDRRDLAAAELETGNVQQDAAHAARLAATVDRQ